MASVTYTLDDYAAEKYGVDNTVTEERSDDVTISFDHAAWKAGDGIRVFSIRGIPSEDMTDDGIFAGEGDAFGMITGSLWRDGDEVVATIRADFDGGDIEYRLPREDVNFIWENYAADPYPQEKASFEMLPELNG